jgi:hypothetical protein
MAESYKVLGAVDLPVLPPPPMLMSPLSEMRPAAGLPAETLVYKVPTASQAIIKMIVCTSDGAEQSVTLRCYSDELGPIPLFGPVGLGPGEWAEWSGSLTLPGNAEIRGAISVGSASVAVYGLERTV